MPVAAEAELGGPEVEGGHCVGGEVECVGVVGMVD